MRGLCLLSHRFVPPANCFQDPSSWGDLSSFEFSEETDSSPDRVPSGKAPQLQQVEACAYRPEGQPLSSWSKTMLSQEWLGLQKSLTASQCGTAPLVILRTKRLPPSQLASGHNKSFLFADVSSSTPKRSPVKSLPFSPSQVEQDFCTDVTNSQKLARC